MSDINKIHLTGTVESFKVIATKTGTPMIRCTLASGKEKITVIAFNEVAESTRLEEGARISLVGSVQSTSWEGKDGVKRFGWQVIANEITLEDEPTTAPPARRSAPPFNQQDLIF